MQTTALLGRSFCSSCAIPPRVAGGLWSDGLHSLFGNHARLGLRKHMSNLTAQQLQDVLKRDLDAHDEGHFPVVFFSSGFLGFSWVLFWFFLFVFLEFQTQENRRKYFLFLTCLLERATFSGSFNGHARGA